MVFIAEENEVKSEMVSMTVENVQFWSAHFKELTQSQRHKAMQFIEFDCIHYIGLDEEFGSRYTFVCLPLNRADSVDVPVKSSQIIPYEDLFEMQLLDKENCVTLRKKPFLKDYNSTVYKMFREISGRWTCNCQGWSSAERDADKRKDDGCQCSHLLALFLMFKMKKFGEGRVTDDYENN